MRSTRAPPKASAVHQRPHAYQGRTLDTRPDRTSNRRIRQNLQEHKAVRAIRWIPVTTGCRKLTPRPDSSCGIHRHHNRHHPAEAYWTLREKLQTGELALPYDEELFRELLSIRWSVTSAGQTKIEPKEEIRRRLGRSLDRAEAVAMAFSVRVRQYGEYGIAV